MTWKPIPYGLRTTLAASLPESGRSLVLTPWLLREVRLLHTLKEETILEVYGRGHEGLLYVNPIPHSWKAKARPAQLEEIA
jgi:hypothetical protein